MKEKASKVAGTRRRCRPLRREKAGGLWFVTLRVTDSCFWLHPMLSSGLQPVNRKARRLCEAFKARAEREVKKLVAEANSRMGAFQAKLTVDTAKVLLRDLVGACLARAQQHCREQGTGEVELFAFVAMSNHIHLVLRTQGKNLSQFMRYFSSTLASGINYLTGRRGQLLGRRYDAQPILDDTAACGRVAYTVNNPRAAGLVEHHEEWPGQLLCFGMGPSDALRFTYFNRLAWHRANRPKDITKFFEQAELTLSPLPHLSDLERAAYRKTVEGWLQALQEEGEAEQRDAGAIQRERDNKQVSDKRVLRRIGEVIRVPVGHRPPRSAHKRRPYAFGSERKLREHRRAMGEVIALHQVASDRWRNRDPNVSFPDGTYAPPITIAA
jgi:REP element-mobilizing transposase RayT